MNLVPGLCLSLDLSPPHLRGGFLLGERVDKWAYLCYITGFFYREEIAMSIGVAIGLLLGFWLVVPLIFRSVMTHKDGFFMGLGSAGVMLLIGPHLFF